MRSSTTSALSRGCRPASATFLAFVTLAADVFATEVLATAFFGAAAFLATSAFLGAAAFFATAGLEAAAFAGALSAALAAVLAGAFFLAAPVFVDTEVARDHSFHGSGRLIRRPMKSL
jgi:hypothetical protein